MNYSKHSTVHKPPFTLAPSDKSNSMPIAGNGTAPIGVIQTFWRCTDVEKYCIYWRITLTFLP